MGGDGCEFGTLSTGGGLWSKGCAYPLGKPEERRVEVVLAFGRHFVVICIDFSVETNVLGFDITLPYAIDLGAERLGGRGRGGGGGKGSPCCRR